MRRITILTAVVTAYAISASAQKVDSSRRAALGQWWTTHPRYMAGAGSLGSTYYGGYPSGIASDGVNLWVAVGFSDGSGQLVEFRASDGARIGAWGNYPHINAVFVAAGRVWFTTLENPGGLYSFDPGQGDTAPGRVADVGAYPSSIAYGGSRIWVANSGGEGVSGSISILTPGSPWSVKTVTAGLPGPQGLVYDGSNMWVTDALANTLLKLKTDGSIAKTVSVGDDPGFPIFDGKHIWVPNWGSQSVTVIDAATGFHDATLTGNGLSGPLYAAFDGKRVLVTNIFGANRVSVWNATDLSEIGNFSTGPTDPWAVCSDGIDFWITLNAFGGIGRF